MNSIPFKRFVKTTESHDLDRNGLKINQKQLAHFLYDEIVNEIVLVLS